MEDELDRREISDFHISVKVQSERDMLRDVPPFTTASVLESRLTNLIWLQQVFAELRQPRQLFFQVVQRLDVNGVWVLEPKCRVISCKTTVYMCVKLNEGSAASVDALPRLALLATDHTSSEVTEEDIMGQQHNLLKGLLSSSVAEWIDDLKERGDVQSRGTDPVLLDYAAWAALSVAEVFIMHTMIERENPPRAVAANSWFLAVLVSEAFAVVIRAAGAAGATR